MEPKDSKPWLFKKGEPSRNPKGRPKGLAEQIRARTFDLAAQITELIRLSTQARSEKTRLEAIGLLIDRAYGKAIETHLTAELGNEGKLALLEGLSLDQLAQLARGSFPTSNQIVSSVVVEPLEPALHVPVLTEETQPTSVSAAETPAQTPPPLTPKDE